MARSKTGELFVGGEFSWVDGLAVKNVARWDGQGWQAMGAGLGFIVKAMAVDEDGVLYAGGGFGGEPGGTLARWKGSSWEMVGGLEGAVETLAAAPGGGVFVGGFFPKVGSASDQLVARYDGADWVGIAAAEGGSGRVSALEVGGGGVCAGGLFESIGQTPAHNVACWDGGSWSATGEGIPGEVLRLTRLADGTLYAGGTFAFVTDPNTGAFVASLARFDAVKKMWVPFEGVDGGFINTVRAITPEAGGGLVVGGLFGQVGPTGVPALSLARYKSGAWSEVAPVGNKLGSFLPSATGVYEVLAGADGLDVAGFFSDVGGRPTVSVAHISPQGEVTPLQGKQVRHLGLDAFADCVMVDGQGRLVVGGGFEHGGEVPAAGVVRWTGQAWEPLGKGLGGIVRVLSEVNGTLWAGGEMVVNAQNKGAAVAQFAQGEWSQLGPSLDGPVFAMATDAQGRAVVGGDFTAQEGGAAVARVAAWTGVAWEPLGDGFDGRVTSLVKGAGGKVYAGGLFAKSGGNEVRGLAVFEEGAWKAVGGGLTDQDYVSTLALDDQGRLVIGGKFETIGGQVAKGLARWDGSKFEPLGAKLESGFDSGFTLVTTVMPVGEGIFVGGIFASAGGVSLKSIGWLGPDGWRALGEGINDVPEQIARQGNSIWVGGPFLMAGGRPSHNIARFDLQP